MDNYPRFSGAHAAPADWLPLSLDAATSERASPAQRASALVIAAAALRSAPAGSLAGEPIATLARGLASESLRACDDAATRAQLLAVVVNAVAAAGADVARESENLFRVLLQLRAAEAGGLGEGEGGSERVDAGAGAGGGAAAAPRGIGLPPAESSAPARAIAALAAACGHASGPDALFLAHASSLLSALAEEEAGWDGECAGQRVFGALLLGAPPEVLSDDSNAAAIRKIFASTARQHREPTLRLALLRALDALFEDVKRAAACGGVAGALIEEVVLEGLTWRAGKTAAAVRYAAVVALGTMLRNKTVSGKALLSVIRKGDLLPSLISAMEEDYYADTRAASGAKVYTKVFHPLPGFNI